MQQTRSEPIPNSATNPFLIRNSAAKSNQKAEKKKN